MENEMVIPGKNPLLLKTIKRCILEYLPLGEIKSGRLVCKEWDSVSQPLLRKRAKIRFSKKFQPSHFLKYYSTHLPELPFTAFKFFSQSQKDTSWSISDQLDFFRAWGLNNIKSLELANVSLLENKKKLDKLDLDPWMDLLGKNLVELKLAYSDPTSSKETSFVVSLDKLANIKNISLDKCDLVIKSSVKRITPQKISFKGVTFQKNGDELDKVVLNDLVDVSECLEMHFEQFKSTSLEFDLAREAANAKKVEFGFINVLNWNTSKINAQCFKLDGCNLEAQTNIQIKELYFKDGTIDLSLLPKTIEKMSLIKGWYYIIGNEKAPIDLPNLKSLKIVPDTTTSHSTFRTFKRVLKRGTFPALVDLELEGTGYEYCKLDFDWMPKSVKKLKLGLARKIAFYGTLEVDILILSIAPLLSFAEELMGKIKPKILVLSLTADRQTMNTLTKFIFKNTQLEKIVVELSGMAKSKVFDTTALSKYVDKKSEYYEFKQQFGNTITQYEFNIYSNIMD